MPSVSTVCGIPFSAANIDPYGISKPRLVRAAEFVTLFYRNYFRVTCSGIEHVPTEGRCMLVGNHSGGFALDAGMLAAACFWELSPPRLAHAMVDRFVYRLPFLSTWMSRLGQFASIGDSVAERAGIGAVRGYVRHQVSVRMLLLLVRCA